MELRFAKRMESFQPGIFNVLNDKKNEMIRQGRQVYNLSVGTPDFLPDANVMRVMRDACEKYASGLSSLDGFLAELSTKMRMVEAENL